MRALSATAIELEDVQFSYDGERLALDGLSLVVEQGAFVCVLGGNGSGKSTFAKHLNALLTPDRGRVTVLGRNTSEPENLYIIRSQAGMVFQNPDDQIVASVIENDVAFGPENLGVPSDELRARVTAALAQVGLQGFEKKQTESLSGGQKQRVAVAGVLAMEPRILILDEASAMLDPRGRVGLLRVCRELNEAGLTIVLITHFMEEAAQADRVVVLENGHVALDGAPIEVFAQIERLRDLALDIPFAAHLSRSLRARGVPVSICADEGSLADELAGLLPSNVCDIVGKRDDRAGSLGANVDGGGRSLVEFDHVSFTYQPISQSRHRRSRSVPEADRADWGRSPNEYWALKDLTFSIREGEFLGIAGHTGSGKSTLIQLANGLLQPTEGSVRIRGTSLSDRKAASEARRDVGVVFQYPERQLFAATVYDDVAFGPRNLGFSADEIDAAVRTAMELVHLDIDELRDRNPFGLSGGQQRRVAFAGVLAMKPHALVLDEPVAGLDPRAKRSFLALLGELHRERGMSVVVVSHNMDDLATMCDRILVLNEGELFALDAPERIFADEERLRSVGLGVPNASHFVNGLAKGGIHLPVSTLPNLDELADALARLYAGAHAETTHAASSSKGAL